MTRETEVDCLWPAEALLGEGVLWHPQEQCVYWVDILKSELHRLGSDDARQTWQFPGALSAVVPCINGGLLATFRDGVYHLDLDAHVATPLIHLESALPGNRFNDGALDLRGNFWFGSMDEQEELTSGQFYRLDCSGEVEQLNHLGPFCICNGPTFSLDGNRVYFTDSVQRRIYYATLDSQGRPGERRLFHNFTDSDGHPDGMCTDTEGGVWVCHFGGGCVSRLTPEGHVDTVVELPAPNVTKCAFGGPDYKTLFISTARKGLSPSELKSHPDSGGLFAIEVASQGASGALFDLGALRRGLPGLVVK